jgi:cell wall-associated NlpC family hydrolase
MRANNFDKRENVFEYSYNNHILEIKTTDTNLLNKVVIIAEKQRLKTKTTILPENKLSETPYGIIAQSVVNLREGTSRTKGMATQALMGQQIKIIDRDGDSQWYKVKTAQGYISWIPEPSFVLLTKPESDSLKSLQKAMITVPTTFAYNTKNHNRVVSDLVYGNVIILEKVGETWSNVILPRNRKAVVKTSEITDLTEWQKNVKFNKDFLVEYAFTFLGQPYLWGGNSYKGIDCSGFSGAIYYAMGLFLPRDASQQIKQGDIVEYSVIDKDVNGTNHKMMIADNLEIGDLLFFGNIKSKKVTHVAIWIGDNQYIHSSGYVHVSSVDPTANNYKEYLVESLLGVRRINGSNNLNKTINLTKESIW